MPGAGKTLVGLDVATQRREEATPTHAVFLSGNGPLVAVLREALTRDEFQRQKTLGNKTTKSRVGESVKAFIQNVHHFRDEGLRDEGPPADHVVIFDEAQRAWNLQQTRNFMQRKKNRPGFDMSEPQFLISYMDRHEDWAFIVCLVGGGQEINDGEAGIGAWVSAAVEHYPHWEMVISDKLTDSEYAAAEALAAVAREDDGGKPARITFDDSLHLSVSMRSYRAENVSKFVKQLLDLDVDGARDELSLLKDKYPIRVTRDLGVAKRWIRERARGTERYGLVASSKAMRLKPHAIFIGTNNDVVNPVHWFLNDSNDVRSSYYLEDAATEFQVQGLELDWVCVSWDADLRLKDSVWSFHDFKGTKWQNTRSEDRRRYTLNAYRVLLTRARQGMVIFVPPGDVSDGTRPPEYYDETCVLFSIEEIADVCQRHRVPLHTDAVQAAGKLPLERLSASVDYMSISGHKIGAPKGIGALVVREGAPYVPLIHGGKQQNGRRGGTEAVPAIVGLGIAAKLAQSKQADWANVQQVKDAFEQQLLTRLPDAEIFGASENRLPNTTNVRLPGIDGDAAVIFLDRAGICVSSGSACLDSSIAPSHVIQAMTGSYDEATECVRISISPNTTEQDLTQLLDQLVLLREMVG